MLDGFDFTILTFLLVDIERSFTVNSALAGALGTVTLMFRLIGGMGAGIAADRWGRKFPLMFSILWYSAFAFFSGFSTSYADAVRAACALRDRHGRRLGGRYAAGHRALATASARARLRHASERVSRRVHPVGLSVPVRVSPREPSRRFRLARDAVGRGPSRVSCLWIMRNVQESPVWLAKHQGAQQEVTPAATPLTRLFQRDLFPATIHASLVMAAFLLFY